MEKYQTFLPPGSSTATTYSSQMAPLGFSSGTTDFGGDSSISSLDHHGFLGQTGTDDKDNASIDPAAAEASNSGKISTEKKIKKKMKNPKYAFQTRSQVDILDDGYRWRKYGQKAVKANKFPRSYYRCTYEGCNVKKQVQRLSKDEGIVVTTYEGMHTHPIEKPNNSANFEHILGQMQLHLH